MRKAFSGLELLIVIVIVGVITSLAYFGVSELRTKARNANRLNDVEQMRTALQLYKNDTGLYPATLTQGASLVANGKVYLKKIPGNVADGPCPGGYTYHQIDGGLKYSIDFCISSQTDKLAAGSYVASEVGMGCTPNCSGRICGSDGCGGACPPNSCGAGETCDSNGLCQEVCIQDCTGMTCGLDNCGNNCYGIGNGQSVGCSTLFGTCNVSGNQTCSVNTLGACDAVNPTIAFCATRECGSDGCGGTCAPNSCGGGETCDASGQCVLGCAPESDVTFCSRLNKNCGSVTANDNCLTPRTVNPCGPDCTLPQTCGGGGVSNVCGCTYEGNSTFCSRLGKECGLVTGVDNCGNTQTDVNCGANTISCSYTGFGDGRCSVNGEKTCSAGTYGACTPTEPDPRIATCSVLNCGGNDQCGGLCNTQSCGGGMTCTDGACVPDCTPSCDGKICGESDGCTGWCDVDASCIGTSNTCDGTQTPPVCKCGSNPLCGAGLICSAGSCVADCLLTEETSARMSRTCPSSPTIGCRCGGGTVLCNTSTANCGNRNIIVSPTLNSSCTDVYTGADACSKTWKSTATDDLGTFSTATGTINHTTIACDDVTQTGCATHPAFDSCRTLNVNGMSDWYLPADTEGCLMIRSSNRCPSVTVTCNPGSGTAGNYCLQGSNVVLFTGYATSSPYYYWDSSEGTSTTTARAQYYTGTIATTRPKNTSYKVRCLRRF